MIVAIDGLAASGKGTLAKALAADLGYAHLDSGLIYRAIAWKVLQDGGEDLESAAILAAVMVRSEDLANPDLRTEIVANAASKVAAIPEVRRAVLDFQRDFAKNPPGGADGAVLDGRDIGTVVCPDADVKIFVTASPEERARRRFEELKPSHPRLTMDAVKADLAERDRRDTQRKVAPAVPAPDAHLLDTTNLSIDSVVAKAKALVFGAKS
jgi:cytidylate kinase